MKVIAFNGSPAGADSSTHVLVEAFFRGARRAGAETREVFLLEKNIAHCRGCFSCWFKTPGECVQQDDMAELLQAYQTSDIVCFATPVYTWNMTAALKNFVDRLTPLKSPLVIQRKEGFDLADTVRRTQSFVVISNCGFPGETNFETMRAVFSSCSPVLEIYRSCGKLLKSKDEQVRSAVEKYLLAVEQAGCELAAEGRVAEATQEQLRQPLMPAPEYIRFLGM